MKPISFSKASTPSPDDVLAQLQAATEQLRIKLEHAAPGFLVKLEADLREARERRNAQSALVGQMYEKHRNTNPDRPPPDALRAAETKLKALDEQVGVLRRQIETAYQQWAPALFRELANHLESERAALQKAIALLTAVAEFNGTIDNYLRAHGALSSWRMPRANQLLLLVKRLQQFGGGK